MNMRNGPATIGTSERTIVVNIWLVPNFGDAVRTARELLGDRRNELEIRVDGCVPPGQATKIAESLRDRLDVIGDAVDNAPDSPEHDLDLASARLLSQVVTSAVRICTDLHPVVLANVAIGAGVLDSGYPIFDFRYGGAPVAAIFPTPPERDIGVLLAHDPGHLLGNLVVAAGRMAEDPLTSGLIIVPNL